MYNLLRFHFSDKHTLPISMAFRSLSWASLRAVASLHLLPKSISITFGTPHMVCLCSILYNAQYIHLFFDVHAVEECLTLFSLAWELSLSVRLCVCYPYQPSGSVFHSRFKVRLPLFTFLYCCFYLPPSWIPPFIIPSWLPDGEILKIQYQFLLVNKVDRALD